MEAHEGAGAAGGVEREDLAAEACGDSGLVHSLMSAWDVGGPSAA